MKPDLLDQPRDSLSASADHAIVRSERIGLTHILRPEVNLAIWQRDVPGAIATWLSRIRGEDLVARSRDIDRGLPARSVAAALLSNLSVNEPITQTGVAMLAHDAGELAHLFAQLSGSSCVRLRLDWVTQQKSPRVHEEWVPMRLLCTYRGAGTEWIANDVTLSSSRAELRKNMFNRLGTGDVAIMKGLLGGGADPLRHRSPPLNDTDEWRLLLSLDPLKPDAVTSAIDWKKNRLAFQR